MAMPLKILRILIAILKYWHDDDDYDDDDGDDNQDDDSKNCDADHDYDHHNHGDDTPNDILHPSIHKIGQKWKPGSR